MSAPKAKTKTPRQSLVPPSQTMPAKMTTSATQIKASPKTKMTTSATQKNVKKAPAPKPSTNQVKPKPSPRVVKEEKKVRDSCE